jgi:hypothetical protein
MPQLKYSEILERVKSEGGFEKALKGSSSGGGGEGFGGEGAGGGFSAQDLVGKSIEIEVQQLPVIDFPMEDLAYKQNITPKANDIPKLLNIKGSGDGTTPWINDYTEGKGQVLINSGRLVLNADKDFLMLFGKNVAIASPGPVNVDSENSVTIFGEKGLFLGVPGKGEEVKEVPTPKEKGDATPNQNYEPLVLGIKLANLLEDLLVVLKNANIITPIGKAYFLEDTQWELASLASRLPEMLSTYAYIDGLSHEVPPPPPKPPDKVTPYPTKLIGTIVAIGDSSLSNSTTNNPAPTAAISSPLKDVPGFYDSVDDLYIIPGI